MRRTLFPVIAVISLTLSSLCSVDDNRDTVKGKFLKAYLQNKAE